MIKLNSTQFRYSEEEKAWFARFGPEKVEVSVPGDAVTGPDQSVFPLAEQILLEFDELVREAESYISWFVDKKFLHIKNPAYGEAFSCGFRPNHMTVEFTFETDVYGYWTVTFFQDREQKWHPKAFSREEQ